MLFALALQGTVLENSAVVVRALSWSLVEKEDFRPVVKQEH